MTSRNSQALAVSRDRAHGQGIKLKYTTSRFLAIATDFHQTRYSKFPPHYGMLFLIVNFDAYCLCLI